MMKKMICFTMLLALLLTFTACSSNPPAADNSGSAPTQNEALDTNKGGDGADGEKGVLYSANGVTVTLNGTHYNETEKRWYVDTTVSNTTDAEVNVTTLESTVNGLRAPLQMYTRCPAGQTVEDSSYIDPESVAHCVAVGALKEISSVGAQVVIIDGEDDFTIKWTADSIVEVAVEPLFIEQSTVEFPYIKKVEQLVYEDDSYRVTCVGLAYDFFGLSDNPYVYFFVENNGSSPVSIGYPSRYTTYAEILNAVENPADQLGVINGAPCGIGLLREDIPADVAAVIHVPILSEKYGVVPEEITTLQFELRICDQVGSTAGVDVTFPVDVQF